MAALLVAISIMAIVLSAALPVWHTQMTREREEELVFRGRQYARAVALFQRKYAGAFPPNVDVLVNERFLRKKFKDPITDDDFELVRVGTAVPGGVPTAPTTGRPGAPGATGGASRIGGGGADNGSERLQQLQQQMQQAQQQQSQQQQSAFGQARIGQPGGGAGIMGVTSKSKDKSLRIYNGRDAYNQWVFLGTEASLFGGRGGVGAQQPGVNGGRGANTPGAGVRGGQPPGTRGGFGGSRSGFPTPGGGIGR
jgi:type II secretory pathway pseudopilin PulG